MSAQPGRSSIPAAKSGDITLDVNGREVRLTNLEKVFWPDSGVTKGDLIQYYAEIAPALLPHLTGRAMVMKRYPHGIDGKFFFMKRAPEPRPDWIETCAIEHGSGSVIHFPIIQDAAALLWVINLGCIDLNPWYARCDEVNRPDFLHFDLDPVPNASWERVVESALLMRDALVALNMPVYAKTTGSRGIHMYVPIVRGPTQKQVWTFAKQLARTLESHAPHLVTAEYRIANRPADRVLVDYNQNAWGRTLASVYSVRPRPGATVSAPVTFAELEAGAHIEDFNLFNVPARVAEHGDLWAGVLDSDGRFDLSAYV
ncbi:MAG TPA: non-homologous end-joining DNA ligase [Longimicrobiales bacterium]|nr:non-homologous end-joining DNA ligase [Longimicrobiales bacterium]